MARRRIHKGLELLELVAIEVAMTNDSNGTHALVAEPCRKLVRQVSDSVHDDLLRWNLAHVEK